MAGVGYQGFFSMDPDPNPLHIPSTGAVLNEDNQPEWEEEDDRGNPLPGVTAALSYYVDSMNSQPTSTINTLRVLKDIEAQIFALIERRREVLNQIENERNVLDEALNNSKRLSDDLGLLSLMKSQEEIAEQDKEQGNG